MFMITLIVAIMIHVGICEGRQSKTKDYSKLIDAFPQLQNSSTPACIKEMQLMFMQLSRPDKQFMMQYSMHYYSDLGYIRQCEDSVDGSYVQFNLGVSNVPLKLPLSFCLPKACGNNTNFDYMLKTLMRKTNNVLDFIKLYYNLDDLPYKIEQGWIDTNLKEQLAALINQRTTVVMSSVVPENDQT